MDNSFLALCTLGMVASTALPRILPMSLLAKREMPEAFRVWLSYVPVAILAALVAPEIFLKGESLWLSFDNVFLLGLLPTLFTAYFSKSLFGTLSVGMLSVALLRYFFGV